jgi:hypothetical protein
MRAWVALGILLPRGFLPPARVFPLGAAVVSREEKCCRECNLFFPQCPIFINAGVVSGNP